MKDGWSEICRILDEEDLIDQCSLNPGATEEALDELEAHLGQGLPASLKGFLSKINGQSPDATIGLYLGRLLLSTEGIREQWDSWRAIDEDAMNEDCADFMSSEPEGVIKPMYSNRRWIPLTH